MASIHTEMSEADSGQTSQRKRTAVLVVHGIGSQRALETVRGVVNAVVPPGVNVWTHPEKSGVDIDLSVMTTGAFPGTSDQRSIDFHELYWAHLMSETRAIAVLLWLFELVRRGPFLRRGMQALWWGASAFVCAAVASVTLITLHLITRVAGISHEPGSLILAPALVLLAISVYIALTSLLQLAWRIAIGAFLLVVLLGYFFGSGIGSLGDMPGGLDVDPLKFGLHGIDHLTLLFLPIFASLCAVGILMGFRGVLVTALTYVLASIALMFTLNERHQIFWSRDNIIGDMLQRGWFPFLTPEVQPFYLVWKNGWLVWSMLEQWSIVIACSIILTYLVLNALFLQSYLGDAARYFRNSPGNVAVRREIRKQAVDTLHELHSCGRYDRIIVVAHSLGTVVAYDMLRAYFSRICNDLPDPKRLGQTVKDLNGMTEDPEQLEQQKAILRTAARKIVRAIADFSGPALQRDNVIREHKKWLVTDFVTLGSALTHAQYLMCSGKSLEDLKADFERRVVEREFPTCPPRRSANDGLLLFNLDKSQAEFHHAAVFGLTRWTNLYFPLQQLLWGDAIGGKLASLFGSHIDDRPVPTRGLWKYSFFTHTHYWNVGWPGGRSETHVTELIRAMDLADRDNI